MGALAAVRLSSKGQQQRRALPLTIASDKSGIGHTEPAAGMSGLVHAVAAAAGHTALPVLHLRALNPYLIGTLEAPGVAGSVSISRQPRGAVLGQHPAGSITGVSSFAFQVRLRVAVTYVAPCQCLSSKLYLHHPYQLHPSSSGPGLPSKSAHINVLCCCACAGHQCTHSGGHPSISLLSLGHLSSPGAPAAAAHAPQVPVSPAPSTQPGALSCSHGG
jgi:hypothetical protein